MIIVGATLAPYVMKNEGTWGSWLHTAEALRSSVGDRNDATEVRFFAALETDARGEKPFAPLIERLDTLGGVHWTFSVRDDATTWNGGSRLHRICTGRNLISHYAMREQASHVLFLDADMCPSSDCLPKLLEMRYPLVGGHVPTYGLRGPRVDGYGYDVQEHMNTAGFLLVERRLFVRLRWRTDIDAGMTDDPCYHADATELGWPTHVRHDVVGAHYPAAIPPIEHRHSEQTRTIYIQP